METRTLVLYLLLGSIFFLGVSLTVYFYLKMTGQAAPDDSVITKNLAVYSDVVKPAPLTCPSDKLLTDYTVAGSAYSVLGGKTVYDYVSAASISKVIEGGARIVELHIYDVQKAPVVGIADEKTKKMMTYNTIPFEDCCIAIGNSAFKNPSPFVLSLVFHTEDNLVINKCADILKNTLRKFMLDSSYSYQRKNLALEPACNMLGRLIIVSGEHHKGNGMDELVNLSWSSSLCRRLTYTQASQTYDFDELINYNRRNITLVVPDMTSADIKNKNPEICFTYGCQWVLMNYGSVDEGMEFYTGKFGENSFILKPEELRYKPVKYKTPPPQNPNVSFQPKRMQSPIFDFTVGSV
jgi:hypothetical protein